MLAERIRERAVAWAIAAVDAATIDRINIYQASRMAMRMAVSRLNPAPDFLLVDAVPLELAVPQRALIKGDARCHAIAAASILAKVQRDACMRVWDADLPRIRTGIAQRLLDAGALPRARTIRSHAAAPPEFRTGARAFALSRWTATRKWISSIRRAPHDASRPAAARRRPKTVHAPDRRCRRRCITGITRCRRWCSSPSAWRWGCSC